MKTDDVPPEGADPEHKDGSLYYCGRESDGGSLAPCTLCEWGGLCPQYADQPGRHDGSREETA